MLEVVVHVETFSGYIKIVDFDSFFLRGIHPLLDYLLLIEMQGRDIILSHIPRNVRVIIVAMHHFG